MSRNDQIHDRLNAVRAASPGGRLDTQYGSSYPEPDYDDFVTVYDDHLAIRVASSGKAGETELKVIREFVDNAIADMGHLLAENERLRLKLRQAGKRVSALVVAARKEATP